MLWFFAVWLIVMVFAWAFIAGAKIATGEDDV
jgi:hypothetical protein